MKINLKIQEMAQADILKHITSTTLDSIKSKDPKPEFRAYIVGHTGDSKGKSLRFGTMVKRWYSDAIEKLHNKIAIGTKLFKGHNSDSSHFDRKTIGEVVGKMIERVGDKVNAIAITWLKPEYRNDHLDICSIEGDIEMKINENNKDVDVDVKNVHEITGIALGDSEKETPGFAGAELLTSIQMFAETKEKMLLSKEENKMDLNAIRKAVSEGKFSALDLFDIEQITQDQEIKKQLSEQKNKTGYLLRKKEEEIEKLEIALKSETEKAEALQSSKKELSTKVIRFEGSKKLNEIAENRKLDETQKKLLDNRFNSFNPETDDLEKELNMFVDKVVEEHKSLSKIYGVSTNKEESKDNPSLKTDDNRPVDYSSDGLITNDMIKNNPLRVS